MDRLDYPLHMNPTLGPNQVIKRAVFKAWDHDEVLWPVVVYYEMGEDFANILSIEKLDKNYSDLVFDVSIQLEQLENIKQVFFGDHLNQILFI